jgi:DNA-binding response OmpR family regulator
MMLQQHPSNGNQPAGRQAVVGQVARILIIEDDPDIAQFEQVVLTRAGYHVRHVSTGAAGLALLDEYHPEVVLLDIGLPDMSGLDVCTAIAESADAFILMVSGHASEDYKLTGLGLGADDYITKPFSLREVVARVCVLLRSHSHETEHLALCCDELVLDAATNRVTIRGNLINLRGVEYRLLEFLMAHAGRTFNRTQLLSQVWGGDTDVDERTVDVNVQRLRKILSERGYEAYIQTVRGFGYRFAPPAYAE